MDRHANLEFSIGSLGYGWNILSSLRLVVQNIDKNTLACGNLAKARSTEGVSFHLVAQVIKKN
jgi:hypothetical protein